MERQALGSVLRSALHLSAVGACCSKITPTHPHIHMHANTSKHKPSVTRRFSSLQTPPPGCACARARMNALGDALGDALGVPVDRSEELHLVACPCAVACAVLLLHLVAACPHARARLLSSLSPLWHRHSSLSPLACPTLCHPCRSLIKSVRVRAASCRGRSFGRRGPRRLRPGRAPRTPHTTLPHTVVHEHEGQRRRPPRMLLHQLRRLAHCSPVCTHFRMHTL